MRHEANGAKPATDPDIAARQAVMATCTGATAAELEHALRGVGEIPAAGDLRGTENGLVMLRGRMGGDGRAFNLGEATVTRATVRLPSGRVGHSYALGRDKGKAKLAAIADALWQDPAQREAIETKLAAPLRAALDAARETRRVETAATKVDFFTMVRGED